jgi:hypothetical protein
VGSNTIWLNRSYIILEDAQKVLLQMSKHDFVFSFLGLFHQLSFIKYHFVGVGVEGEFIIVASLVILCFCSNSSTRFLNHVAMNTLKVTALCLCPHTSSSLNCI